MENQENSLEPVTREWLLSLGMRDVGNGILAGADPQLVIRLQEVSPDFGQLIDFYHPLSSTKLINVYSAYYSDRRDFFRDDIYKNIFWKRPQ